MKVEVEEWKDAILKAVLYHNRRDLPEEFRNPLFDFDSKLRLSPSSTTSTLHLQEQ